MNYWLVKQEPEKYNWDQLVKDRRMVWDGVRNYQARNNLQAMRKGDRVLIYHSVSEKAVRGIAAVARQAYPDPTSGDPRWLAVDLEPVKPLSAPVTLEQIKNHPRLKNIALIRQSRLSVMPLSGEEFQILLQMGETRGG